MAPTVFGDIIGDLDSYTCDLGNHTCIPRNYSKYELPESLTYVSLGIDIMNIPNIDDNDFSVTLSAFLNINWRDSRIITDNAYPKDMIPIDVNFMKKIWLPDLYIRNLQQFKTQYVLSNQEGLSIYADDSHELLYQIFARITFYCPMTFDDFPLDIQVCLFQVHGINQLKSNFTFKL